MGRTIKGTENPRRTTWRSRCSS